MITKNAVDYNGTIPEKYDVVEATHKVFAEYGNVGTDFQYITQEGFGWMNASYQYGLTLLDQNLIDNLNQLKEPKLIF
jgi:alpha,alpha-trehalase